MTWALGHSCYEHIGICILSKDGSITGHVLICAIMRLKHPGFVKRLKRQNMNSKMERASIAVFKKRMASLNRVGDKYTNGHHSR
mmetsp:Transcript_73121/g.162395  ORF Transcript_73121/g.162395 Transcript_73121/m.162395 type:complete len:84 (+) Transcript_73121:311-562(+)